MDYFGPFHVKIGRRKEKRWGVIFNCLSIKAIHLEISHTLNSESTILRMVARKGQPKIIFCDDGTHFLAAAKKLKNALQNLNNSFVVDAMSSRGIEFRFNPPGAPHKEETCERLIGFVKRIISKDLYEQYLKEEPLQTFSAEAEHIGNFRSLTRVSSDPSDLEALTQSSFLWSSSGDGSCIRLRRDNDCLRRE
ncbi:uncharacterized protein [Leptinotarsa decemlineata]|uniref:uncharacterized protein n=1 Tax=Leptinotarsa decemlineata TaxID=7539 RepID=UPI003D306EF2